MGEPYRRGPKPRLHRQEIIDAALECGGEAITMQAVADRLHASPSAIYRYFAGRDDLILAALGEALRRAPMPVRGMGWRQALRAEATLRWDILTRHSGLALNALGTFEDAATPRLLALVETLQADGFSCDSAVLAADTVLDLVHDGARQAVELAQTDDGDPQDRIAAYPALLQSSVLGILNDPRAHVERKLELVLDGLDTRRVRELGRTWSPSPGHEMHQNGHR